MNDELKKEIATQALEDYNFGAGVDVADSEKWNKDGDIWSIKIYLDDIDYDDTIPASFTIWWEGDKIIDTAYQIL